MYGRGSEPSEVSDMSLNCHASSLHSTSQCQPVKSRPDFPFCLISPRIGWLAGCDLGACQVLCVTLHRRSRFQSDHAMAYRPQKDLTNAEWEHLCGLLQRARYEGRVSGALMEANVVAPSQLPLRKCKAKAKPKSRQMVHRDESSVASSVVETVAGAMTDASKRLAPDGRFTMDDLPDDVAYELYELPEDLADGFSVVEEPLVRELWMQPHIETPPQPTGMGYLSYDDVDERIQLPVLGCHRDHHAQIQRGPYF